MLKNNDEIINQAIAINAVGGDWVSYIKDEVKKRKKLEDVLITFGGGKNEGIN